MLYVGLDYHQSTSSLCILNDDGKVIKQQTVRGRYDAVAKEVAGLEGPRQVVFEATGGYGPLHAKLTEAVNAGGPGGRVVMAHPAGLRLIWKSKRKNDTLDAKKLATMLYLDAIPPAHVPAPATRQWRRLVELRRSLVRRRTQVKNGLHALLRTAGLAPSMPLFSRAGIKWLKGQPLDDASSLERLLLVEQLEQVRGDLKRVEKELHKTSDADPRVTLLMTVPGVGPRTAEAFVAYVDRIDRFGRTNEVGSYFGLVPCQDASAGKERLGHITKQGPPAMRQLLTEAAWTGIRRSPRLKARFERLCGDDPRRKKKIAIVAMSRHLSHVMAAMLRDDTPWSENPKETAPKETAPKETAPKETAPKETAPKETAPKETAPKETAPKETAPKEALKEVQ